MPLLTRARRVSQCHRCRYVFSRCLRTPEDTKGKEVSNASSSQTRCERTESRRVLTFCTGTTYFLRYRQIEEPDTPSRRAAADWDRWLTLSTISLERESAKDFLDHSDRRLLCCEVMCPPERARSPGRLGFFDRPRVFILGSAPSPTLSACVTDSLSRLLKIINRPSSHLHMRFNISLAKDKVFRTEISSRTAQKSMAPLYTNRV